MSVQIKKESAGMNPKRRVFRPDKVSEGTQGILMILPQIIGFLVFSIYPIIWVFRLSFYYYNANSFDTKFVGLKNFITLFTTDISYWKTWIFTFKFALIKIPFELCFALFIALLLKRNLKGKGFFRAMFYLPNVISVIIIGLIFSNLFNYFGFVNGIMVELGILRQPIEWFANQNTALFVLAFGSIWNTFGANVMYLMVALANVPDEVYESAQLDGAGKWRTFRSITLPLIAPTMQTIILLSLVGTLGASDYIIAMTGGAPAGQTHTVMSYQLMKYVPGFGELDKTVDLGYGCSISFVTSVIFMVISLLYTKASKKMKEVY